MNNEIVPICLYKRGGAYIGFPEEIYKNGEKSYECTIKPNKELFSRVYVINPTFRPIPPGMVLFCATGNDSETFTTISLKTLYDPFNVDNNCTRFIAWIDPVPYTTPLYIFSYGSDYFISFNKEPPSPEYSQIELSPIHVLVDSSSFRKNNGIPQFKFSNYHGRCIPDPNGSRLSQCIQSNKANYAEEPSLLNYLRSKNKKETNPFNNVSWFVLIFLVFLFIASLGIIVYKKYK